MLADIRSLTRLLLLLSATVLLAACGNHDEDTASKATAASEDEQEIRRLVDDYLESFLKTFPTRATAAGDHRADRHLEDFSLERLDAWIAKNREVRDRLAALLEDPPDDIDLRLDAEATHRRAALTVFRLETLDAARHDPLFWAAILGRTSVFLLVRDDLPLDERLDALSERVGQLPRLCSQAKALLSEGQPDQVVADKARMAAAQVAASATLYDGGLVTLAESLDGPEAQNLRERLRKVSGPAAEALRDLASMLEALAERATGEASLGKHYAESFRLGTGLDESPGDVLARAEADLVAKRAETAAFCRSIWTDIGDQPMPSDEKQVIRACFRRIAEDRTEQRAHFVEHYRQLSEEAHAFVIENEIMTLPGPMTLRVDSAPPYLAGQAVGGVYPSGPFTPEADTLLFVPSIPDDTPAEMKLAFYGDFNDHFNVMITPHETSPGHYAQFKLAALNSSKTRAIFGNGVYIEGWGTFSERLMLDHGWGTPLARVAHLKKQLENIARTIVDIRVHSQGMDRDEMLTFLREEAMQDGQFAINMWTRAITSSPQLTTYYLGYRDIMELYEDWRAENPQGPPKEFSDRMMSLGAVPMKNYRALF